MCVRSSQCVGSYTKDTGTKSSAKMRYIAGNQNMDILLGSGVVTFIESETQKTYTFADEPLSEIQAIK